MLCHVPGCRQSIYKGSTLCPYCRPKTFRNEAWGVAEKDPGFREFYSRELQSLVLLGYGPSKVEEPRIREDPKPQAIQKRLAKPRVRKKRTISIKHWIMVREQGNTCALCGVEGWGAREGVELEFGVVVRAKNGPRPLGIFCQTCAFLLLKKLRPKAIAICRRKRELCGDGPRTEGEGG